MFDLIIFFGALLFFGLLEDYLKYRKFYMENFRKKEKKAVKNNGKR